MEDLMHDKGREPVWTIPPNHTGGFRLRSGWVNSQSYPQPTVIINKWSTEMLEDTSKNFLASEFLWCVPKNRTRKWADLHPPRSCIPAATILCIPAA
jgi:hypothetical protein